MCYFATHSCSWKVDTANRVEDLFAIPAEHSSFLTAALNRIALCMEQSVLLEVSACISILHF